MVLVFFVFGVSLVVTSELFRDRNSPDNCRAIVAEGLLNGMLLDAFVLDQSFLNSLAVVNIVLQVLPEMCSLLDASSITACVVGVHIACEMFSAARHSCP